VIYGPFEGVYPGWAGNDLTISSPDGEVVSAMPIGDVNEDGADDLLLTVDRGGDLDPWNEVVPGAVLFGW
jgi:hypothetical protein